MTPDQSITVLFEAIARGDDGASDRLFSIVYDELHAHAARQLAGRAPGETLQATSLVNEAFVRLFENAQPTWQNGRHFFFAAARAMHDVTVHYARRRATKKRGGDRRRVELDVADLASDDARTVLEVDGALARLREHDPFCADIVLLRFFGGLTHAQIAEATDASVARVRREWTYARAWLREHVGE